MYGICPLSAIPLRSMSDDRSEMVSQVLFGEFFTILEKTGNWLKIKLTNDDYEGWIDRKQALEITADDYNRYLKTTKVISGALAANVKNENSCFIIPMGSNLPFFTEGNLKIGNDAYHFEGPVSSVSFDKDLFILTAKSFLKSPYLWGGKTMFGIDCSGFSQIIMNQFGVSLFRDASQQALQGNLVHFTSQATTGDLAFFENSEGKISHVGLILEDGQIIHAHGEVRIDQLDDMGIYNEFTGKHSHRLRFIKRFFE